jgi:cell division protein FtsQ
MIRLASVLVMGLLIFGSFHFWMFLTTTKKLAITTIRVDGVHRASLKDVYGVLDSLKTQNILRVPLFEYTEELKRLPRIKEANLKKIFPSEIVASIREREPVALVYTDHFMEIDDEGMVLAEGWQTEELDLPIITGLSNRFLNKGKLSDDNNLRNALETLRICKLWGGAFADNISEIKTNVHGVSIVSLNEGFVVIVGSTDFEKRLKKFFLLKNSINRTDSTTKVIDLRFDDQVVLRSGN